VIGGLALHPFVREPADERVLRLRDDQVVRAVRDERGKSDAPETA
jgi:hypothetical protein